MDNQNIPERILRLKEVVYVSGLSKSKIYADMSDGIFPKSLNLGGRSVGWLASDIAQWIKSRKGGENDH